VLYQKGGAVFTEIQDQPRAWKSVIDDSAALKDSIVAWLRSENFGQVLLVGSGDSYGVALSAASILHLVSGLNTVAKPSCEILYLRRPPYDSRIKSLVLAISADGEDLDTLWAVEKMRKLHPACKVLFLGAAEGQIGGIADQKLIAKDTLEETPVRTRSVSSMLLYSMILTAWLSGKDVFIKELEKCGEVVDFRALQDQVRSVASVKPLPINTTFLGSGPYYGVALYAAKKFREMASLVAGYDSTLEFRHGYQSWLTNQTMTVSLISDTFREAELTTAFAFGITRAQRVLIADTLEQKHAIRVEHSVELKSGLSEISRILLMYPAVQLMSFYVALAKGVNPDKPREMESKIVFEKPPGV
jgi:glucosamine--fructose-6-phosphate aminotransferase (isomerizing)